MVGPTHGTLIYTLRQVGFVWVTTAACDWLPSSGTPLIMCSLAAQMHIDTRVTKKGNEDVKPNRQGEWV